MIDQLRADVEAEFNGRPVRMLGHSLFELPDGRRVHVGVFAITYRGGDFGMQADFISERVHVWQELRDGSLRRLGALVPQEDTTRS